MARLTLSVPPGLIAAGIVSAWTWAATLLQSSATAYVHCVPLGMLSNPIDTDSESVDHGGTPPVLSFRVRIFRYTEANSLFEVLLFAMIASKLKMNAPYCHTSVFSRFEGACAYVVVSSKSSTLDGVPSLISCSCSSVSPRMSSLAVGLLPPLPP
jgi:hypothetical protein